MADLKINVDGETCLFFTDEEKIQWRRLFDVEVPVVPVEDNIVFKAILQRTEKQGKHDIEDIQHTVANEKVDSECFGKKIRKYRAEKKGQTSAKVSGNS